MENDTVSVIIPCYNSEKYIEHAIDSVIKQNYKDIELILVDDGSNDDTLKILNKYARSAKVFTQNNKGTGSARNLGLKNATGTFIAFLDSDDLWHEDKLKMQVDYLKSNPEIGAVYNKWEVINEHFQTKNLFLPNGNELKPSIDINNSGSLYTQLILDCIIHTSSILIRSEIIKQVGEFNEQLVNGQDYDYWIRLSRQTKITQLRNILSFYRCHSGNTTSKPKEKCYGYIVISNAIKRWGNSAPDGTCLTRKQIRQRLNQLLEEYAYSHLHNGSKQKALFSYLKAVTYDFTSKGSYKGLLKLLLTINKSNNK